MPICIEKVVVTVTFPNGEKVEGITKLPPRPTNPLFTLYDDDWLNGRIINQNNVRDVQYQVIERKAK